jgi:outer membrane protein OmpA-like peptidoglycan-associated protein
METDEQKKKISLKKDMAANPSVASVPFAQRKKVSLDKQPAVEPAVAPMPPKSKKKISLDKQTQEMPASAKTEPVVSVPSASKSTSAPAVSSAPVVSKPVSAYSAPSTTAPRTESADQVNPHPATGAGYKKEKASSGQKIIIIIIAGIVIMAIVILLLWRNCGSEKQAASAAVSETEFVQPSQETSREPEPAQEALRQPGPLSGQELALTLEIPELPDIPALTYGAFYFMGDSSRFLPGSNYEERLSATARDMKNILTVKPGQVFLISGYSADIPGHNQGEMELSIQRADKVRNSLIQLGVPQANLECAYMGGTSKWGDNISELRRRPNRVVTIETKD